MLGRVSRVSKIVLGYATWATLALLGSALVANAASAQTFREFLTPPRAVVDSRAVDVVSGDALTATEPVSIGELGTSSTWAGITSFDKFYAYVAVSGGATYVFLHGKSIKFTLSAGVYTPADGDGSKLTKVASPETYTYTSPDGSVYYFGRMLGSGQNLPIWMSVRAHLLTITRPNGELYTYNYRIEFGPPVCGHTCYDPMYIRVQSITTTSGHMLKASYASSAPGATYNKLTGVKAINLSQDYCDPNADTCTALTQTWASQTITESVAGATTTKTITDQDSNATIVDVVAAKVTDVTPPTSNAGDKQVTYDVSNRVDLLVEDGASYDYSYSTSGSTQTTTVIGPGSATETYVVDTSIARPTSITTSTGNTTTFLYDASARNTRATYPEGNYTQFAHDARGNVTEVRHVAKAGSGLADIVTTASFDATCTNVKKCNQPNYTIDALGNRIDYTYDTTHGGTTKIQMPAPTSGGTRPEINYVYTSLYAQQKNSSGTLVNVATPQYKVTQITTCATAATCAGTANETKVTIAYNTPNLKPSSVTTAAGDGSISATTGYTYNLMDDVATIDGPLPGTDDTTYYFYTLNHRLRGTIGPDPDGAGPRTRAAVRNSYLGFKPLLKTEAGTVTGTNLAALTAMVPDQTVDYSYDSKGNKIKEMLTAGGTMYQAVQYSYDTTNRLECTALRMNPAIFTSLPASACTAGAPGSGANDYGADRITQNIYDAANRVTQVKTAVGTAELANEVTTGYTANGQTSHVIDAENNKTGYVYDGHDRLLKTEYPSATKGANAVNAADYEQLGYDANSNVTSRRLRDGQSIGYAYDNLGRLTAKTTPGIGPDNWDVAYSYDLLGRVTQAIGDGWAVNARSYDALGRMLVEQNYSGTSSFTYDAAGRRTSIAYPGGGLTVNYDYDITGQVTAIKENGSTTLASYAYDSLGRRASVTYGNGVVQSFGFDPVSRLQTLTSDLGGTSGDQIATFGYNPASQIDTLSKSNSGYAWLGHYNIDRLSASNGLNQLKATTPGSGQVSVPILGYDLRGNLTHSASDIYSYNLENRMFSASNGAYLTYEPLEGQLLQVYKAGIDTRFVWAGPQLLAEIDGTNWQTLRRYVHGPGVDEPILWYEGAGLTDKRYLTADERGSIVAVTNSGGGAMGINTYDEYGIPAATNLGRFQYTGQTWLPEIGMYYYKARMYSATLGRFMQTDPIGYADGMNWYNYVGSDPVNMSDPSGLARICATPTGTRIPVCVDTGDDNKLTYSQAQRLADQFRAFILANGTGKGASITSFAKPFEESSASARDKEMMEAAAMFVGASLTAAGYGTQWSQVSTLKAGYDKGLGGWATCDGDQAYECMSIAAPHRLIITGMRIGWSSVYSSPSELARLMIHSVLHLSHGFALTLRAHQNLDRDARNLLRSSGLGGGGCSGQTNMIGIPKIGAFPAC